MLDINVDIITSEYCSLLQT